jgi:lysyl-tRNA synthetase class 2
VTFHDPAALDDELAGQLARLATLSRHGEAERGFSMTLAGLFDPQDTGLLLSVARDADGTPQGFVKWVPVRDLSGWSLDVMRRSTAADLPNGVMDFLVIETIHHVSATSGGGLDLYFAIMRAAMSGSSPVGSPGWGARRPEAYRERRSSPRGALTTSTTRAGCRATSSSAAQTPWPTRVG